MGIKCDNRTQRHYTCYPLSVLSHSWLSWLLWVLERGDKRQKNPTVINITRLHHHRFTPFPPYSFFSHSKNACLTCTISAVNNSVSRKVNFQFAQRRVTITFWPANGISPLIPHHFISGSLCSVNWGRLYLVVTICLLFSWCLDVQPDHIREQEG